MQSEDPGLQVIHQHAAGVDVGNSAHYVAVRPDQDSQPVRRFECFTADLYCRAHICVARLLLQCLHPILKRLGIPHENVGLHAFRHVLATELAESAVPLPV